MHTDNNHKQQQKKNNQKSNELIQSKGREMPTMKFLEVLLT
jgi:hypothetical protein